MLLFVNAAVSEDVPMVLSARSPLDQTVSILIGDELVTLDFFDVRPTWGKFARTLGVEWARLGVRTVTLLPGPATGPDDLAELVGYVASPAGDYFSGTAIALA